MNLRMQSIEPLSAPLTRNALRDLGLSGLQVGCGTRLHAGCLNTDRVRFEADDVRTTPGRLALVNGCHYLQHDATDPFPAEDETFDWIFSEHFIEHITPGDAIDWLREARRLLRPGGHVRLSTPDLRKYIDGYLEPEGTFVEQHQQMLTPMLSPFLRPPEGKRDRPKMISRSYFTGEGSVPKRRAFIFNQVFLLPIWDHKWIYDVDELRYVVERAGFAPDATALCTYRKGRLTEVSDLDAPVHAGVSLYAEIVKT